MRPPSNRVVFPNIMQPVVKTNFMEYAKMVRPNPKLSEGDVVRTNVMKQVTTIPAKFRMLPLQDPNEHRQLYAAFDIKAPKVKLAKHKQFPMCNVVHQFE